MVDDQFITFAIVFAHDIFFQTVGFNFFILLRLVYMILWCETTFPVSKLCLDAVLSRYGEIKASMPCKL